MNCQPGDLAFVVRSSNPENLMKIVEVIKALEPQDSHITITTPSRQLWLCESQGSDLVWSDLVNQPMTRGPRGPIPDECLRPIRPEQEDAPTGEKTEQPAPTAAADLQHA